MIMGDKPAYGTLRLQRPLLTILAAASVTLCAYACGDGTTEPADLHLPTAVTVSPATATVVQRDTLRLTATATNVYGQVVTGVEFEWASGNTAVAVVDSSGLVTGVGAGQAEVTATAAGVTGRAELAVVAPLPTTVVVTPDTVVLTAFGQTVQLAAEVRDQAGQVMDGAPVAWSSAETTVAAVDASGLVTAVGGGAVRVTATAGEASGDALVTVNVDRAVLMAFYSATDGPNWVDNTNWLTDAPLGTWYGVETNAADRVVRLDLSARWDSETRESVPHGLKGEIPPELGGLARLQHLDLYGNSLSGAIPAELGDLASLQDLDLQRNRLSGSIPPELGNLASLRWLDLARNDLTGPIPPELGNLANLERLNLDTNKLDGRVPAELGALANLTALFLGGGPAGFGGNDLTGPIPPELGNLSKLRRLWLGNNDLSGPIPSELGNLTILTQLSLGGNDLTGSIPAELGNLGSLEEFAVWGNNLTGAIPPQLGRLHNLTSLSLGGNSLDGSVPPELGNLANLTEMYLWGNDLSGPIPSSFLRLNQLRVLSFVYTQLCTPGTIAFVEWLRNKDLYDGSASCNAADVAVLTSLHEATGGAAWADSRGWLEEEALENWYGVTADSIGRLTMLDLTENGLTGQLPSGLSDLSQMTVLRIGRNPLTGRLPLSLARLPLVELYYEDTQLCAPVESNFRTWLNAIASHQGSGVECTPVSDRDVLETFYRATNGPDWVDSENWLTDAPLNEWYGVETDGSGRVTGLRLAGPGWVWESGLSWIRHGLAGGIPIELANLGSLKLLDLGSNDLTGTIPPELGNLANLESLYLRGNSFSGAIPPELGRLRGLRELDLAFNDLTGTIPPELGRLRGLRELDLGYNGLTGTIPPELVSLGGLRALALYYNNLDGPIPPELGNLASLESLDLQGNGFSGAIPPELGRLRGLRELSLASNDLAGPIPPELASVGSLWRLDLRNNSLDGPIPPVFGNLASLAYLNLADNGFSGPIPRELGDLTSLYYLNLDDNSLSGPIPRELGDLTSLYYLHLDDNSLSGSIPPQLGSLGNLRRLYLASNDLAGPVPPQVGRLSRLQELGLSNNESMAGALPADMTALSQIEMIQAGATGLCAPRDSAFEAWLSGIRERWIARCLGVSSGDAYLTQAVQSREFPVPLVAGDKALLRVFATAARATSAGIPQVRARFYRNGRETHAVTIPGTSTPIPTQVTEGELASSANAEIPGHVIQPGVELVIEVDPDGTLDPGLGVARRIPETGRLAVDVETTPLFDLTVIPFVWSETHDSSIVDLVSAMAADPENHDMLEATRTLLPVGDLAVTAHPPVVSSTNSAFDLLDQTDLIRVVEGGTGHYKGMMAPPVTGAGGVAYAPGKSSFSQPYPDIIAHELGHNFSLLHAPCGRPSGIEPWFPYPDGSIGAWGFDFREAGRLIPPFTPDLMSYCGPPNGISDYLFTKALRFRLLDEGGSATAPATTTSLLVWGGMDADSVPFLEPAFVVDAPPVLPDSDGDQVLAGWAADGRELFSFGFTMAEMADSDGDGRFIFALPVQPGWEDDLAAITLSGPAGTATLDGDSDIPMAILRDPRTGQIRGFLRDAEDPSAVQADATGALATAGGLDVLFSRGIPGATAWRR